MSEETKKKMSIAKQGTKLLTKETIIALEGFCLMKQN